MRFGACQRAMKALGRNHAPATARQSRRLFFLEQGGLVDAASLDPALQPLFASQVQGFLVDAFRYDPAALISDIQVPALTVQGACPAR